MTSKKDLSMFKIPQQAERNVAVDSLMPPKHPENRKF